MVFFIFTFLGLDGYRFSILIPSFRQTSGVGVHSFFSFLPFPCSLFLLTCLSDTSWSCVFVCLPCFILFRLKYYNPCLHLHAIGITTLLFLFLFSALLDDWSPAPEKRREKGKKNLLSATVLVKWCLLTPTYLYIYIHIV